jgi:hypothetical protein
MFKKKTPAGKLKGGQVSKRTNRNKYFLKRGLNENKYIQQKKKKEPQRTCSRREESRPLEQTIISTANDF